MGPRTDFHEVLLELMRNATGEEPHVYFQPPEARCMEYPCIVYEREYIESEYAENVPYLHIKRYSVTVIDKDPDSIIPDRIAALPMCRHDRHFVNDNLHHDVFTIYY